MKKYTLYCGLNDKDSRRQEISTLEAAKVIRNACLHHADGATIFEADGIYRHEDGRQVSEKTLRVCMDRPRYLPYTQRCNNISHLQKRFC